MSFYKIHENPTQHSKILSYPLVIVIKKGFLKWNGNFPKEWHKIYMNHA